MTRMTFIAATLALAVTLPIAPAQALVARTFVSAAGSDSNNCANVATPCRHFAAAFAATSVNGEIYVLDPANYGSLTITHAVSIQGHGWGSVAPQASGNAITINATSSDDINLDGLTIDGTGLSGTSGIVFNSGKALTVTDCVVRNVTNYGLNFAPNQTTAAQLAVSNSYFNDNGFGVVIQTLNQGAITAAIDRTGFSGNVSVGLDVSGLNGTGNISVAVTDSVAANNTDGYVALSTSGHSVTDLSLTHSLAEGNGTGVLAQGTNASIWLALSTLTGNGTGFNANTSGTINSYGDNYLAAGNGPPVGSLSGAIKQ